MRITQPKGEPFMLSVDVEVLEESGERRSGVVVLDSDGSGSVTLPATTRPTSYFVDPDTRLLARFRSSEGAVIQE